MPGRLHVAYHFLAHYRAAVFRLLAADPRWTCRFFADPSSAGIDPSIAVWSDCPADLLEPCRVRRLPGGGYVQWRTLWRILVGPRATWLVLGDMRGLHVWLGAVLGRLRGHRVLFWAHGWTRSETGAKALLRRAFFRLAHGVVLYGRRARQIAVAQGFPAERLHVIYNSLDVAAQRAARAAVTPTSLAAFQVQHGIAADRPALICTTRLTRLRRLDLLIDAVAALPEPRPSVLLVGDGPERATLHAHAAARQVDARFLGAIYDEAVIAHVYACARLTVAPGKVGLTAMHSMAYGVPVLTHGDADDQMPEWEAIVPGRTGDCFARSDVAAMRDAISHWLARADRERIAADCAAVIDRFYNPERQVRELARAIANEAPTPVLGDRIQAEELA